MTAALRDRLTHEPPLFSNLAVAEFALNGRKSAPKLTWRWDFMRRRPEEEEELRLYSPAPSRAPASMNRSGSTGSPSTRTS